MRRTLQCKMPALTLAVLLASSCTSNPSTNTAAESEKLMRHMSDTLANAPAFRFTTAESLDHFDRSTGRVLQFTRTVTVRRPDAMNFELAGSGDTVIAVSAFYDGKTVSLRDNARGVWTQTAAPGKLDEMLDDVARRYSLPVPFADVIYSVPYEAFIGSGTKGGYVGDETINGIKCAHFGYIDNFVDVQVWIPSSGQPLPRRVELVYKRVPGAPKARIDFTSWDLAPQIVDGAFSFQPGKALKEIAFEQLVNRLLSGESPTAKLATPSSSTPGTASAR